MREFIKENKLMIIILSLVVVIGAIVAYYLAEASKKVEEAIVTPPAGAITIRGEMVCLPHKGNPEVQTLECAFGLKDAEGRYFSLSDTDPEYKNVSGVPMNTEVEVVGTFTPKDDDKYESVGLIAVTTITEVSPNESPTNGAVVPTPISVTGTIVCLPHKGDGPHTMECRYGLKTSGGNYALDFQNIPDAPALDTGLSFAVSGMMTPVEMLSSETLRPYDVKGIITVSSIKLQ